MVSLIEVTYRCPKCGASQTLTFFPEEHPLTCTVCVPCKNGFGLTLQEMIQQHKGMFPTGQPKVIEQQKFTPEVIG